MAALTPPPTPTPAAPDKTGLMWGLRSRISNQLPRDAHAAGPGTTLRISALGAIETIRMTQTKK